MRSGPTAYVGLLAASASLVGSDPTPPLTGAGTPALAPLDFEPSTLHPSRSLNPHELSHLGPLPRARKSRRSPSSVRDDRLRRRTAVYDDAVERLPSRSQPQRRATDAPADGSTPPTTDTTDNGDTTEQDVIVGTSDPVAAANLAEQLPNVFGNTAGQDNNAGDLIQGDGDESQLPWNTGISFLANANTNQTSAGGWEAIPDLPNFTLNRSFVINQGAIQPFYISANYNPAIIKRAVIVMPGKPRDSWKYTSLMYNALQVATRSGTRNVPDLDVVNMDEVLIIGPMWLNNLDQDGGSVLPNELVFHGTQWQSGGYSRVPALNRSITTYEVLDAFTDMLFDTAQFPLMNNVVVAGHSMGGQMVQRYALLKKAKPYDNSVRFWIGNPGSWAWLTPDRPFQNASCTAPDEWIYGIGGNVTKVSKYARKDVQANATAVVERYRGRNIHYALGLLDEGPGDTHCQAILQGGNHLDRGAHFVLMLGGMAGGFPASQTVDFIANTSHQDYPMYSANASLVHLFADAYDERPTLVPVSNPGDVRKNGTVHTGEKAFATRGHELLATLLLAGTVLGTLLAFIVLPFLFPVNHVDWESESWTGHSDSPTIRAEGWDDSKRRLL